MRAVRIGIILALGSGLAFAACSNFSEENSAVPDAGTTSDGGREDAGVDPAGDGAPATDAPTDSARSPSGCSDGTVEGYANAQSIAACAGAWSLPGVVATPDGTVPVTCERDAGNSGNNATGSGCSAGDLCAVGWHVCKDNVDVARSLPPGDAGGPCELAAGAAGDLFFATSQPSSGSTECVTDGTATNDVLGCGDLLTQPDKQTCGKLNALLAVDHPIAGWSVSGAATERSSVVHVGLTGGVLCCAD